MKGFHAALFFILILAITAPLKANEAIPDADYAGAVWVAQSHGLYKIATADGRVLLEIPAADKARAVAVDERGGVVWAFGQERLQAYDFGGRKLSETPIAVGGSDAYLVVDPLDGTVWLAAGKALSHVDGTGRLLATQALDAPVLGLAFDAERQRIWVGDGQSLHAFGTDAQPTAEIRLPKNEPLRALEIDRKRSVLWAAYPERIVRLDDTGRESLSIPLPEVTRLAGDDEGGLWAATQQRLYRIEEDGRIVSESAPFDEQGSIVALSAGLMPATVWAASQKQIANVGAGELLKSWQIDHPKRIGALAHYTDRLPPELVVVDPPSGAYVNASRPAFTLSYVDIGRGVNASTLLAEQDDIELALECRTDEAEATCRLVAALLDGRHTLRFTVEDFAGNRCEPALAEINVDTAPPVITVESPSDGVWVNTPEITVSALISESADVTLNGQGILLNVQNGFSRAMPLLEGANPFSIVAADRAGNTASTRFSVTLDTVPPPAPEIGGIHLSDVVNGAVTVTGGAGSVESGARVLIKNLRTGITVEVIANADGSFSASIGAGAGDVLSIQVADKAGNLSGAGSVTLPGNTVPAPAPGTGYVPPDPATFASALDPTSNTTLFAASEFLYSGSRRIQHGVEPGTIEERRVAVLRGKVQDRDGNPIPGITITVLNHPEFGWTGTRTDGQFDLVVNGGGILTVNYEKTGYLPVQRQLDAPWSDWAWLPDVVMIALDPQVTSIALGSSTTQVARGSAVTDADGTRQATVLFPQGTNATLVLPNGTTAPLTTAHVRATEYTVGENGMKAMPGPLPPTVGYTYAVELSVDEAIAAGAKEVRFDRPVYLYVDNFLHFPVGGIVPMGWYSRDKAAWVPSDNGRIVQVLSVSNGVANLDVTGSGQPADADALATLGITDVERAELAGLYQPGKSLWRVPVTHFTPWDCNWPYGPPTDAESPPPEDPQRDDEEGPDDPCEAAGCVIEAENQVLGESIPIVGTPYTLNYRSNRQPGYVAGRVLEIPLSRASVPGSLKRIELEIQVAGQVHRRTFAPAPNLRTSFTWDGKDGLGRRVQGSANLIYHLRFVYPATYVEPTFVGRAFGQAGTGSIGRNRDAMEVDFTRAHAISVIGQRPDAGLSRWTLDSHHAYDVRTQTLYRGDGSRQRTGGLGGPIDTVAGNGTAGYSGDGGPATAAQIRSAHPLALGPDGSVYFVTSYYYSPNGWWYPAIRRITPDGTINTAVPWNTWGWLEEPTISGLAIGADNSIYITDSRTHRLYRLAPTQSPWPSITTIAGTRNAAGSSGDGGSATSAKLNSPSGVALGPDGTVYVTDTKNHRIRRIAPDGIITTIAGTGSAGFSGDGGPATQAQLESPSGPTLGPDGAVYFRDSLGKRVRRIGRDGIIDTIAGSGVETTDIPDDSGEKATQVPIKAQSIAIREDGGIYLSETWQFACSYPNMHRVRLVRPDGIITTVAGKGSNVCFEKSSGDGGPALLAKLSYPSSIALAPDGRLYVSDGGARIRRFSQTVRGLATNEFMVPSSDNSEYHVFGSGQHRRTIDSTTGAERQVFTYDARRNLAQIRDGHGNTTVLERDGAGKLTAIVAPDGQRTELVLDANGYLASVTHPSGEVHHLFHTPDGLLTEVQKPSGARYTYHYDLTGRLTNEQQPDGGGWALARTTKAEGFETTLTSGEGRTRRFGVERLDAADVLRTTVAADGTSATRRISTTAAGITETAMAADGTRWTQHKAPDSRDKMDPNHVDAATVTTPGGLSLSMSAARKLTLADAQDPLSLTAREESTTVNGRISTSNYNAATRTWTSTTPASRVSVLEVDTQGKPVLSQFAALSATHYDYDLRGRLIALREGEGTDAREVRFTYDMLGQLESVTDSLERTTRFEYDLAGRVTKQILPDQRAISYGYDKNGNLTSLIPPGKEAHVFSYTKVDLEEDYTPPDLSGAGTVTRFRYNRDKQLTALERPDGKTVQLSYDPGGRLETTTLARGSYRYTYHPTTGQLSTLAAPDGNVLTYTYNGFLPLTETATGEINGTVSRGYDNNFWVTSVTVNDRAIVYGYDQDGLLTKAGSLTLSRNAENGLLTGTALGVIATSTGYNAFGELSSETATLNGQALMSATYTRDKAGRISGKTETLNGVTTTYGYAYDPAGRLEKVFTNGQLTATYAYDSNGNRLSKVTPAGTESGTYDAQDRMTSYANASYEYTANGELEAKTESGATTHYVYDELGNLTQVRLPGDVVIDYLIDGRNRRIGKKLNGQLVQAFLYQDQLNPVAELDGDGNVVARFIYGSKSHVPDYMEKDGKTYRIVSDHLGSPRLVVDTATGEVAQRMAVDEFGNVLEDTNPGFLPFGFAGGIYDLQTGLVRFGARDYDGKAARWTAKDPIRFGAGDSNVYTYVSGDPVNFIDPTGLICFDFDQFANEIEQNRSDLANTLALASSLAVGAMPKTAAEMKGNRGNISAGKVSDWTNQMSRWQGRYNAVGKSFGMGKSRALRDFGRTVAGKVVAGAATVGLIADGFYNWWVIGKAAANAASLGDCECQ